MQAMCLLTLSTFLPDGTRMRACRWPLAPGTPSATNFYKRLKRYLKHKYSLDGATCYAKLRDIFADEYEGDDVLVLEYRAMLPKATVGRG